ncbi:MAG: rhomboid family intramembrane serine protease [Candidatus Kapabacteria bacterium]|nr:rhomboid family intramembrane serine protease [Candidatus Kapabacteria bacterium]
MSAFPPVIKFLLLSNVGIFLFQALMLTGLTFGGVPIDNVITQVFALWPVESGLFFPWQVLSYQFMHGGIGHLFFNMLALWMFGMELEHLWGSRRFAVYYLLCGVAAAVVHLSVHPIIDGSLVPTIGASGSIMGVLLAFGMTFPDRPIMMFPLFFPIPARIFVMIYAGFDLLNGLMNTSDGVAHFAHLGGALGGFLLMKFGSKLMQRVDAGAGGFHSGRRGIVDVEYRDIPMPQSMTSSFRRPEPPTVHEMPQRNTPTRFMVNGEPISQEQIDAILDKISHGGYHGLSEREKNILFEVSRQL